MDQFTSQLYNQMNQALQRHAIDAESTLHLAEISLSVTASFLTQLKDFIVGYCFKDLVEEIRFFKHIKPGFLSEQVYFIRLYHIESTRPVGTKETQKQYYQQVLANISVFLEQNRFLYLYYRTGRTDYDERIFVRNAEHNLFEPEYALDIDNRFSTLYSQRFAEIQALERLSDYILTTLERMEHGAVTATGKQEPAKNLVWTESNVALVELVYALHARGSINHGKADIKDIVTKLESFFNVKLGNVYRVFLGMGIRKKSTTPYLDSLKESLQRKLDEKDL